jgi:hypothetical protein
MEPDPLPASLSPLPPQLKPLLDVILFTRSLSRVMGYSGQVRGKEGDGGWGARAWEGGFGCTTAAALLLSQAPPSPPALPSPPLDTFF